MGNISMLTMVRGDSFDLEFPIPEALNENDRLYFGIMDYNKSFEDSIIQKIYDSSVTINDEFFVNIHLDPDDTQLLLPGRYYYMIKLQKGNEVFTLCNKKNFIIFD